MRANLWWSLALTVSLAAYCPTAMAAEDAFFDLGLNELKITEGELPKNSREANAFPVWSRWHDPRSQAMSVRVTLDGPGEAYVHLNNQSLVRTQSEDWALDNRVLIRAAVGKDVTGRLAFPKDDRSGMQLVKFVVPAASARESARETFLDAKYAHYQRLIDADLPGAAWYRHQLVEVSKMLPTPRAQRIPRPVPSGLGATGAGMEGTYALFSGGRAISENLQLDRVMIERSTDEVPVDISSIKGITIDEIDWKPLLKDAQPKLDPLAALIPADQHVLFFPSFAAAVKLSDEAGGQETLLLRLAEPRSEDAGTQAYYERQLGLSMSMLSRALGPTLVGSMAVTGSDPYFRTGTDVAVLFETKQPTVLKALLLAKMQLAAKDATDVQPQSGEVEDISYNGLRSADRRVCGYVAELRDAVVVANSLAQLGRLASVGRGTAAIESLDEYKFFRHRYPLGDENETAFLFLSDATIRRWCSPRWRIASSRRVRAGAVLAELQAQNLVALATDKVQPGPLRSDLPIINAGELTLTARGVESSGQGTLAWMTPIVEIPIETVTRAEAQAYNAWRDGYEQNWQWAFDPIGLRLTVRDDKLAGDLTVMPLILGTEYRQFVEVSRGAEIAPEAGDRHDALAHIALAINTESPVVKQWSDFASMMAPGVKLDPLGWLGSCVALYVDNDPLWKELAEAPADKREELLQRSLGRLPIAVRAEVTNTLKLAAFLTAMRAFIEQSAPGLTTWESLKHRDQAYVRITPSREELQPLVGADFAIYYYPSADGLTITLSEPLVKRVIDRRLDRMAAKAEAKSDDKPPNIAGPTLPWLGSNFCLQVTRPMLEILAAARPDDYQHLMQARAWSNLPILNEWKRMFPDEDPVELHERLWHSRLICPGDGQYTWNDEWQTLESTIYGHPGEPKPGPGFPAALARFATGNFGLTFEDQGLRARVDLTRQPK